ncbi:hypothetical protein [Desulfovibrio sp. SGI.169]|uniref:hypothetical protein n=1 Tax=Desulfovibrio sp. SGI.169 TaxID=3420561 RepID=UPI003D093D4B
MSGKYDDIIRLPRHVSAVRPRMSMADRAAQFSPFAALTGHHEAVREVERHTLEKIELDEQSRDILTSRLQRLLEERDARHVVSVTYFSRDAKKDGGAYVTLTGVVDAFMEPEARVVMADGVRVPLADIIDIQGAASAWEDDAPPWE